MLFKRFQIYIEILLCKYYYFEKEMLILFVYCNVKTSLLHKFSFDERWLESKVHKIFIYRHMYNICMQISLFLHHFFHVYIFMMGFVFNWNVKFAYEIVMSFRLQNVVSLTFSSIVLSKLPLVVISLMYIIRISACICKCVYLIYIHYKYQHLIRLKYSFRNICTYIVFQ